MILVDTTFIIDCLRKKEKALEFLKNKNDFISTSEINIFEILVGIYGSTKLATNPHLLDSRIEELENFLLKFEVFDFDRNASLAAAKILGQLKLKGKPVEIRDAMIAGIALSKGIKTIVTQNIKHFSRIPQLAVITY